MQQARSAKASRRPAPEQSTQSKRYRRGATSGTLPVGASGTASPIFEDHEAERLSPLWKRRVRCIGYSLETKKPPLDVPPVFKFPGFKARKIRTVLAHAKTGKTRGRRHDTFRDLDLCRLGDGIVLNFPDDADHLAGEVSARAVGKGGGEPRLRRRCRCRRRRSAEKHGEDQPHCSFPTGHWTLRQMAADDQTDADHAGMANGMNGSRNGSDQEARPGLAGRSARSRQRHDEASRSVRAPDWKRHAGTRPRMNIKWRASSAALHRQSRSNRRLRVKGLGPRPLSGRSPDGAGSV